MLLRSGLLMCIGFIGASAVAVAVMQLVGGDIEPLRALALGCCGGVLAVAGWRGARQLLEAPPPLSRGTSPLHRHTRTRAQSRP
ncbi:MAG: hypothetical protein ABI881_03915 [Betaproteobacteria bacterium]